MQRSNSKRSVKQTEKAAAATSKAGRKNSSAAADHLPAIAAAIALSAKDGKKKTSSSSRSIASVNRFDILRTEDPEEKGKHCVLHYFCSDHSSISFFD